MVEYGPELVSNGNFDTTDDWTFGSPWTWMPGDHEVVATAGTGILSQAIDLVPGATYEVACQIYIVGATLVGRLGGTEFVPAATVDVVAGPGGLLEFEATVPEDPNGVALDTISVKRKFDGSDYYNVYRGQDGVIDEETPIAVMSLAATEIAMTQDLPAGTIWHYVRKQVRGDCDLEGEASDPCVVRVQDDGDVQPASPNMPQGLIAEALAGGKVKLQWRYSGDGQAAPPHGFAIYQVQLKPFGDTPAGVVLGGSALLNEFTWTSEELADGTWLFQVVAWNNNGGMSLPAETMVTVDGTGPAAIQTLLAEVEE